MNIVTQMKFSIYRIVSKITPSEKQLFYKEVGGRVKIALDLDLNASSHLPLSSYVMLGKVLNIYVF